MFVPLLITVGYRGLPNSLAFTPKAPQKRAIVAKQQPLKWLISRKGTCFTHPQVHSAVK